MRPSRRVTTSGVPRVFTTDQGPLARPSRCVQTAAERRGGVGQWCLAHVFHRMVKFQVQQLYNGKYFGSLAKVVNLWRSHKKTDEEKGRLAPVSP